MEGRGHCFKLEARNKKDDKDRISRLWFGALGSPNWEGPCGRWPSYGRGREECDLGHTPSSSGDQDVA